MASERWKTQQQNPGYVDGDEGVHDDDSIADKQKTNKRNKGDGAVDIRNADNDIDNADTMFVRTMSTMV